MMGRYILLSVLGLGLMGGCGDDSTTGGAGGTGGGEAGADGDGGSGAAGAAGGAGGGTSQVELVTAPDDGSFVCSPDNTTGTFSVTTAEACVYNSSLQRLQLSLITPDFMVVRINGFEGVGSYDTTGSDADSDTFVGISGSIGKGDATNMTSGDLDDCIDNDCTIEVTAADVTTAEVGGRGGVTLTFTCPILTAQSAACQECSINPTTFDIEIAGCEHTN